MPALLLRFGPWAAVLLLSAAVWVQTSRVSTGRADLATVMAQCERDKAVLRADAVDAAEKARAAAQTARDAEFTRRLGDSRKAADASAERATVAEQRLTAANERLRELHNDETDCSAAVIDDTLRLRAYGAGDQVRQPDGGDPGH